MFPVLWQSDGLVLYTHDFFTVLGLVVGLGVYYYELRRRAMLSYKIFWISLIAILGGGLGCRLITAWEHLSYYTNQGGVPFTWLVAHSGKSIIGGIAGGYLAIKISKKAFNYRISTGDCYAPAIPLAMAIGRIGCFLAELPLGKPTELPWGIAATADSASHFVSCPYCLQNMHPSMIYEIIFHLIAFVVILRFRHLVIVQGDTLKLYLLAAALFRFLVEFVRANPEQFWGLTGPQIVLIPLTGLLLWYFIRQLRKGVYRMPPAPPYELTIEEKVG
ncbi:MAG: prolipoprotein diacylglyceryl transferase [Chloroflexi bacterium]|uniref:Prolipoprotein diacylglyceryl transferase n=1 Tax=Candidatus Chlorohelix allophototropha TaxID=3003348 RepID=A0A8T7M007_9CHLR|nr:prolipoprotein diacylglyceryl transferase [Chloroflexota bacterium]WJW66007.1 prolipoprotein diacylglyceryl transferase [Chloroflexota bacterium L227-S17]